MLRLISAAFFLLLVFTLMAFAGDRSDREVVVPAKPVKTIRIAPDGSAITDRWVDIPVVAAAEAKPAAAAATPAPAEDPTGMLVVAGGVAAVAVVAVLYVLGVGRPTRRPQLEERQDPPRPTWLTAGNPEPLIAGNPEALELTTSFEEQLREIVVARQGQAALKPMPAPFDPYA